MLARQQSITSCIDRKISIYSSLLCVVCWVVNDRFFRNALFISDDIIIDHGASPTWSSTVLVSPFLESSHCQITFELWHVFRIEGDQRTFRLSIFRHDRSIVFISLVSRRSLGIHRSLPMAIELNNTSRRQRTINWRARQVIEVMPQPIP